MFFVVVILLITNRICFSWGYRAHSRSSVFGKNRIKRFGGVGFFLKRKYRCFAPDLFLIVGYIIGRNLQVLMPSLQVD